MQLNFFLLTLLFVKIVNGQEIDPTFNSLQDAYHYFSNQYALNPKNVDALFKKGCIEFEFDNCSEGLKAIDSAINKNPTNPNYFFAKGYYMHKKSNNPNQCGWTIEANDHKAKDAFAKCLLLDSNQYYARCYRSEIYVYYSVLDSAELDLKKAIIIAPNIEFAHLRYGDLWLRRGYDALDINDKINAKKYYSSAIIEYNKALKINPKSVDAYQGRGSAKYRLGDKIGNEADMKKAAQLNPDGMPYQLIGVHIPGFESLYFNADHIK